MFAIHDKVVRKSVALGVRTGIVKRVAGDYLTVLWTSGRVTTVSSSSVLLATPENLQTIEMKRL